MSNSGTDIFMDLLSLTSKHLSEHDNHLVQWILHTHDARIGDGFSGFDIGEMPWNKDNLYEEKEYLISIVTKMKNKLYWLNLGYEPNEEILTGSIERFVYLLSKMCIDDICGKDRSVL